MRKQPNIILIIMDTASAKHSSLYGYHRKTTPYLERIGEEAVVYKRCFSPARWTTPSHASLFTGLYPSEHGCDGYNLMFASHYYSLVEILKSSGYKTFGISSNGFISQRSNFHRGFDEFHEMFQLFNSYKLLRVRNLIKGSKEKVKGELNRFIYLLKQSKDQSDFTIPMKLLINKIYYKFWGIKLIRKNSTHATLRALRLSKKIINKTQDAPVFLFINFMQTHSKFNPSEQFNAFMEIPPRLKEEALKKEEFEHYAISPYDEKILEVLNALYDGEMLFLDSIIWDIYCFLKKRNIFDNTMFIITSDHGELIGEHGHVGHNFTLHNELLHVPLVIKYPGGFNIKGENSALVQLHDIFATISEIVDSPFPISESSKSLLSSKREFALSQSLDVRRNIRACKNRNPSLFREKDFMQPHISVITKDMLKLTKRADGYLEFYDLNKDFYDSDNPVNLSDYKEKKQRLEVLLNNIENLTGYREAISI